MNAMNERISAIGVVPVIKLNHPERDAAALGKALSAGGVPVAEITFRAAGADIAIKLMKEANPEMIVGAGTVTNTDQIDAVLAVGGEFIVTPGFDPELVAYAQEKNIPLCDLKSGSRELYRSLGPEKAAELFVQLKPGENPDFPEGHDDKTHFNAFGADRICRLLVGEMKSVPCCRPFLK